VSIVLLLIVINTALFKAIHCTNSTVYQNYFEDLEGAPNVRGEISAIGQIKDDLYYFAEDDCHFCAICKITYKDLIEIRDNLKLILKLTKNDPKNPANGLIKSYQVLIEQRKNTSNLVTFAISNTLRTIVYNWIKSEIELLERVICILES